MNFGIIREALNEIAERYRKIKINKKQTKERNYGI